MTNEIKEILDNFKDYELRYKQCNENQFIIFYRDLHLLLDYITNLQEDNERLNNEKELFYKISEERLNKWLKLNEENNELVKIIKKYNENYKLRIDKAVEYINKYEYQKYCPGPYEKDKYIMREEKEGQDLLNILRGDE